MEKQFVLIAVRGKLTQNVFGPAIKRLINIKKTEIVRLGNYRGWILEIRNADGSKIVKFVRKELTYEEKIAKLPTF